ncbi:class I SAM-dependent methyltransferase [Nonomuraea sp. NN258]|uniref:class I SAM-dependent methyltransferase n=1 Tax=Nonomuraea antri TaxID=2730852 RepID=UPI00156810C5|nr:class I SAM-dependent methyltransferase [Nonomuraea antri]NRQ35173.1 class I SAM-dependent methyltransferase [Nonomuraea antri]
MADHFDDSHDRLAEIYDQWVVGLQDDADQVVAFLAELADRVAPGRGRPRLLELGVGSGRIALPLSAKGFDVTGVDASEPMLALLRAKEGADRIKVFLGDFADLAVPGAYDVAFVVYNTLYCLATQEAQVRCLRKVARRLRPGGALVVQAFVPDIARFDRGAQSDRRRDLAQSGGSVLRLGISAHDRVRQLLATEYELAEESGDRSYDFTFRYIWPSELDLMAKLAHLRLDERWAGWQGEPFGESSGQHVSVFRKDT